MDYNSESFQKKLLGRKLRNHCLQRERDQSMLAHWRISLKLFLISLSLRIRSCQGVNVNFVIPSVKPLLASAEISRHQKCSVTFRIWLLDHRAGNEALIFLFSGNIFN